MEKIGIAWSFCFSGIWYWLQDQFPNTEVASVLEAVLMAINQILGMVLGSGGGRGGIGDSLSPVLWHDFGPLLFLEV